MYTTIFLALTFASICYTGAFVPLALVQSQNQDNILHIVSERNQRYNTAILEVEEKDFQNEIMTRDFVQSSPVPLSQLTTPISSKYTFQIIYHALLVQKNMFDLLKTYIAEFNYNAMQISHTAEFECVQLVTSAYNHNIYKNWLSVNDIKQYKDEFQKSSDHTNAKKNTFSSLLGTITSLSTATLTGDVITPAYMASQFGGNLYDYLKTAYKTDSKMNDMEAVLTEEQTQLMNEKLFTFSKIYCVNAFHLHLHFNEVSQNITLIGDRIDYIWMTNLINVLMSNLDLQITKKQNDNDDSLQSLISYKQKLVVLRTIVHSLSELVGYSFHIGLQKQLMSSNIEVIQMKSLFNDKLEKLVHLTRQLKQTFPETEMIIEEKRAILTEHRRLKQLENDLKLFEQETDNLQQDFQNKERSSQVLKNLYVFTNITKSYINVLSHSINFGGFTLRSMIRHTINLITSIPLGLIEGIGYSLNDLIWTIISNIWLLIIVLYIAHCFVRKFIKI